VLSEQGKRNIEQAFQRAARGTVVRTSADVCDIALATDPQPDPRHGQLVLITVSSFAFRLITIFQVRDTPEIRSYYLADTDQRGIDESFHEVANLCCGALNREFSRSFAHLAMSTPYTLDARCISYLAQLQPQLLSHYLITINGSVQLRATLCMCCTAPVDIQLNAAEVEQTGELELF